MELTIQKVRKNISDYKKFKMGSLYREMLSDLKIELLNEYRNRATDLMDKIFFEYLYIQRKTFGFDFDDLINFALYILETDKEVRQKW